MKIIIQTACLLLLTIMLCSDLSAQEGNNDQYFKEQGSFASRLWYGGGFQLGLNGGNGFNNFIFGVSPMVGYKITEQLSIGPRIGVLYNYIKGDALTLNSNTGSVGNPVVRDGRGVFNFSGAIFTRYKAFENFFAHVEIEVADEANFLGSQGFLLYDEVTENLAVLRQTRENVYAGIGYTSGYPTGFEVVLLYNFSESEDSFRSPFEIRVGFNHRF